MKTLKWRVGDITVTSVPESQNPTGPRFIYNDVDKKRVQAICKEHSWIAPTFVTDDGNLLLRMQSLIVDAGKNKVIVDTCVGNDKKRHNPQFNMKKDDFLDRMAAAGYPRESITAVVCTHLHVDHCGFNTSLVDGKWVPTFPNARYYFAKAEFDYWRVTAYRDDDDIFNDSVKPVMDAGLAELVEPTRQLCEGVRLVPTIGHTPGHVSVVLESRGKRAVITGDSIHNPLQIAVPTITSHFDWDSPKAVATRIDFLKKWTDGQTLVIGTHFADPTAGVLRARGGDSWELDANAEAAKAMVEKSGKL
ncbi:Zn-dependent hydrolase [Hyaloraphidium curvatum]|nr:Zn-dependent hydrolase [Hyaloraphidium curvatum]